MKYIKAWYGDWKLVSDEYAELFIDRMYSRTPMPVTKEYLRSKHVR